MALLEKHDRKLRWRETLDLEVPQVQQKSNLNPQNPQGTKSICLIELNLIIW